MNATRTSHEVEIWSRVRFFFPVALADCLSRCSGALPDMFFLSCFRRTSKKNSNLWIQPAVTSTSPKIFQFLITKLRGPAG